MLIIMLIEGVGGMGDGVGWGGVWWGGMRWNEVGDGKSP